MSVLGMPSTSAIYQQARAQLQHFDPRNLAGFVSATDLRDGIWNSLICTAVYAAAKLTTVTIAGFLNSRLPVPKTEEPQQKSMWGSSEPENTSPIHTARNFAIFLIASSAGLAVSCLAASRLPSPIAFSADKAIRVWVAINLPIYLAKSVFGQRSRLLCTISLNDRDLFHFAPELLASFGGIAGYFKDSSPVIAGAFGTLGII